MQQSAKSIIVDFIVDFYCGFEKMDLKSRFLSQKNKHVYARLIYSYHILTIMEIKLTKIFYTQGTRNQDLYFYQNFLYRPHLDDPVLYCFAQYDTKIQGGSHDAKYRTSLVEKHQCDLYLPSYVCSALVPLVTSYVVEMYKNNL